MTKKLTITIAGSAGSGKTTIATLIKHHLREKGINVTVNNELQEWINSSDEMKRVDAALPNLDDLEVSIDERPVLVLKASGNLSRWPKKHFKG